MTSFNLKDFYSGHLFAGVDEVGRGPLAGDVVAAAVILPAKHGLAGLTDSKKLSEKRREALFEPIMQEAIAFCIARATVAEIDQLNILNATLLAMTRAIEGLSVQPEFAFIDGNKVPKGLAMGAHAVVKGDSQVEAISAASILAKVTRDREMMALAERYPGYGFEAHKGYGTKQHLDAIAKQGPCPIHRMSFAPLKQDQLSLL